MRKFTNRLSIYELYVAQHTKATRYGEVKKHLETLKTDKTIQSLIRNKEAKRECYNWLKLVDNYINAGKYKPAEKYLNKILDKYGDTEWGRRARERKAKISGKAS